MNNKLNRSTLTAFQVMIFGGLISPALAETEGASAGQGAGAQPPA